MSPRIAALALAAVLLPSHAFAGNIAQCEAVISAFVEDEAGGGADISSFRDPADFFVGVYDDEAEVVTEIDGFPIRAIICERRELMPDEDDYAILATGVMLSLSQQFDSKSSDMLSIVWYDGRFRWQWKSDEEMDPEMKDALVQRLAEFSERDHGLDATTPEPEVAVEAKREATPPSEPDISDDVEIASEAVTEAAEPPTSEPDELTDLEQWYADNPDYAPPKD